MRVAMRYGKKGLELDLPDDIEATVIHKKHMPVAPDKEGAVREALSNPVGCRPLSEEAKGCKNVCICICDVTRPVPNGIVLPPLVDQLIEAGVAPEAITILVATGLHRPNEGSELREIVGSDRSLRRCRRSTISQRTTRTTFFSALPRAACRSGSTGASSPLTCA